MTNLNIFLIRKNTYRQQN